MKTLVRIAIALENIQKELHIFNQPSGSIPPKKEVSSSSVFGTSWTREEDEKLIDAMKKGMRQEDVAKILPGRTIYAIGSRWNNHLKQTCIDSQPQEFPYKTSRKRWTKEEEDVLRYYIKQGLDIKTIQKKMNHRSYSSISTRMYKLSN